MTPQQAFTGATIARISGADSDRPIHVWEVMSTRLLTATPDEPVWVVSERALRCGIHHLIVVHSSGAVLGMLCGCDMERAWPEARVGDCMSTRTLFVGPALPLAEAAKTMERYGIGALPVLTREGQLVGVVTRSDLRRHGALPGQRGVDCCASCGASHSLRRRNGHDLCFCESCAEAAMQPRDDSVLGGEG